jgi:hypothetical protein
MVCVMERPNSWHPLLSMTSTRRLLRQQRQVTFGWRRPCSARSALRLFVYLFCLRSSECECSQQEPYKI